jgi:hypothetical protein
MHTLAIPEPEVDPPIPPGRVRWTGARLAVLRWTRLRPRRQRPWAAVAGAAAVLLLGVGAVVVLAGRSGDEPGGAPTASLFAVDEGPASAGHQGDRAPVELGVRFTASVDGAVVALRYFRSDGDDEEHATTLWSPTGEALATTAFVARDRPGWQEAALSEPVALTAGEVYVASYHSAAGYAATVGYFARPRLGSGPIAVPADGTTNSGVFRYGDAPGMPQESWASTNYWVDVVFEPGGVGTDATPPTSAATPRTLPPGMGAPEPSTAAPASTAPGRAAPGVVGFRGERGSLTVIDGPGSAPRGTSWKDSTLIISSGSVTLDRVWVKGSIDFDGSGTLTVTHSVVEASGSAWSVVVGHDPAGELHIRDSTIAWPADVPPPAADWGNGAVHGDSRMVLVRNDISGTPDGVQQGTGNSVFEQNYIHGLRTLPESHNDGIQLYGGPGVVIRGNYIVLDGPSESQNAAVFLSDDGGGFTRPVVDNNYLLGGGFVLRLEDGCEAAVVTGNDFGPLAGYGEVDITPGASVTGWRDNVTAQGVVLPRP